MRIIFVLLLVLSGCAIGQRYTTIDDVPRAPNLPRPEEVAAIGLRAKQMSIALLPQLAESISQLDLPRVTSVWISTMSSFPTDTIVSNPDVYLLTCYALAHQWGATQIAVDYLRRMEEFIGERIRVLNMQRANLAWSNFFLALSSMGYGLSSAYSQNSLDRFSNELAISRNSQAMQMNNLLSQYHSEKVEDIATLKHKVMTLKNQLVSYAKLLEIYRGWLFEAVERQKKEIPPDAKRILEVKIAL